MGAPWVPCRHLETLIPIFSSFVHDLFAEVEFISESSKFFFEQPKEEKRTHKRGLQTSVQPMVSVAAEAMRP